MSSSSRRQSRGFGQPWRALCSVAVLAFVAFTFVVPGVDAASSGGNETLLWGPYKPNLYVSVRPRIPKSITAGLMWMVPIDYQNSLRAFRHTCEQNEGMHGYGWDEYDVRTGGRQTIHDTANKLDLTTEFVKIPGGEHGGNWAMRVRGNPTSDAAPDMPATVFFYVSNDGLGSLERATPFDERGYEGDVEIIGETPELSRFNVKVTAGPTSNRFPYFDHAVTPERPLERAMVRTLRSPPQVLWQTGSLLFRELKANADRDTERFGKEAVPMPPQVFTIGSDDVVGGNLILVQKSFVGAFEFDILFSSESANKPVTSNAVTKAIAENSKAFDKKYLSSLPAQAPFNKPEYDGFSKSMFSNLLGGIGYFYGDQIIDKTYAPEYEEDNEGFWEDAAAARAAAAVSMEGPFELFTAVPSRPFFPRGFLWDEGFHLLPMLEWDIGVVIEILRSWFRTMDEDGWLPREQILGPEARSKVPGEFQTQYPHYANPPTLFIAIERLCEKLYDGSITKGEHEEYEKTLRSFYPLMKRNYEWYRKTQKGDMRSYDRGDLPSREGYRWRGRTPTHILTSGLDDYPRAQPPHPGELHVDLMSWMGLMARSMSRIAKYLDEKDDVELFAQHEKNIAGNVQALHWDEKAQTFCDSTIDEFEEPARVCHKGYVSIAPFLTGLVGYETPQMGAVLDLLGDSEELWSPHGIRSLSKRDALYGTEENYWRSPVWMNMNYMILDELRRVAGTKGKYQKQATKLYSDLRQALVETVYKSWKDTGFAWEQYNPDSGQGQRTQHFTGWTSLVVKMMTMPDLTGGASSHGEL